MDPLTLIGGGLGAVGLLGGLFNSSRDVPVPQWSDVDLQTELPDLYNQFLNNQALIAELNKMYAARSSGPTASENAMMGDALGGLQGKLVNQGLAGSGLGFEIENAMRAKLMDQVMERAMQERMGLLGQIGQQGNQNLQSLGGLYEMAMKPRMAQYAADVEGNAANNQFFSGMFSGGLGMMGAGMSAARTNDMLSKLGGVNLAPGFGSSPNPIYGGVGGQSPFNISGYQPNFR